MRNRATHVGDRALNRGEAQPSICLCQASSLAGRHRVEPRWKCAAISLSFTHTRSSKSPLGHLQELDSELVACERKLYFIAVAARVFTTPGFQIKAAASRRNAVPTPHCAHKPATVHAENTDVNNVPAMIRKLKFKFWTFQWQNLYINRYRKDWLRRFMSCC